jgi:hypothetical protein
MIYPCLNIVPDDVKIGCADLGKLNDGLTKLRRPMNMNDQLPVRLAAILFVSLAAPSLQFSLFQFGLFDLACCYLTCFNLNRLDGIIFVEFAGRLRLFFVAGYINDQTRFLGMLPAISPGRKAAADSFIVAEQRVGHLRRLWQIEGNLIRRKRKGGLRASPPIDADVNYQRRQRP